MLENLFTNVFGRTKSKSNNKNDSAGAGQAPNSGQMTGPFSMSTPQMPQPPTLPYPPPAPYPADGSGPSMTSYYPSLPFSQPPAMPSPYRVDPSSPHGGSYPTGTLASSQMSPLDSVPFEARLTLNNSTNLVSLDQLFSEIKKAADVVDRVDAYLRSNQSDYDFKIEQGLIYQ